MIELALGIATEKQLLQAQLITSAFADLGTAYFQSKDIQVERDRFDPVLRLRQIRDREKRIPRQVADTFLDLAREGKVPTWALRFFDLEDFVKR